jgi:hypothetical protein
MIPALRLLLPAAFLAYFVCKALRQPLFAFGIPFLQVMKYSLFSENIKPLWIPGGWEDNYNIIVWMALAWAWCVYSASARAGLTESVRRRPRHGFFVEEYLVLALALLTLGKLLLASTGLADTDVMLDQYEPWFLLPAGYLLLRGGVIRSNSEEVASFLKVIAVATGIGSLLFIIHQGLGIHIYDMSEHTVFVYNGRVMTRTFMFMPPFLVLPLVIALAKRSWDVLSIALAVVALVAIVVSYTRVHVLEAAAAVVVLLGLRLIKDRKAGSLVRRLLAIGVVIALVVAVLLVALPTSTSYFVDRVADLTNASAVAQDPNVQVRSDRLGMLSKTVADRYPLTGAPLGVTNNLTDNMGTWTSDSAWIGVLYWTGFTGLVLIAGMFLLFGIRALRLSWTTEGTEEFLGAVYFAVIVSTLVGTSASWAFMQDFSYPAGFWMFAFLAGEAARGSVVVPLRSSAARGGRTSDRGRSAGAS